MNSTGLEQIRNYFPVNDLISSAGQPTADQFSIIRQNKFELVINLALPDSPGAIMDEAALVRQFYMDYIHIPVDFNAPSLADLGTFLDTLDQHRDKRIFIHCALNWRVSVFIYLFKRIRQHIPSSEALPALFAVWKPDETWQKFIETALAQYQIQD